MKEVTILGLYRTTLNQELLKCEVWSLNDYFGYLDNDVASHVSKCFQIHNDFTCYSDGSRKSNGDLIQSYNNRNVEVITGQHIPNLHNQTIFPFNQITLKKDLFTSSLIYMLQYAELFQYTRVNIMGVRLALHSEYVTQVPALLEVIDILRSRGVEINVYRQEWEDEWRARQPVELTGKNQYIKQVYMNLIEGK